MAITESQSSSGSTQPAGATRQFQAEGKDLYAVAIERLDVKTGQPTAAQIFHIHAEDAAEALGHYRVVYPNRRTHRIVGAAPCIGHFLADKQGKIVSAT